MASAPARDARKPSVLDKLGGLLAGGEVLGGRQAADEKPRKKSLFPPVRLGKKRG